MRFSPWLTQSPLEEIFKSFYSRVESKLLKKFFSIFIMFNTKYIISRKWYWKEYWIDSARIEFAFIITCFVFRVNLSLTKKIQIRTKSKEQKIPFNNFSRNWVTWLQNKMLRCFICFFKLGFTPCKAKQGLRGMELQEKEAQKD